MPENRALLKLERASQRLSDRCDALLFTAPVACTYNPLHYAASAHRLFLRKAKMRPTVLFVGMNPGPFGMAQTGVPFGEIHSVRNFLAIHEGNTQITTPPAMHPKRPIEGFSCKRSEVSGARVWSWARERFETADRFFESCFIWNWCPLAFMSESGANITPDKLPRTGRGSRAVLELEAACDDALHEVIAVLQPAHIVGFGAYARLRAERVVQKMSEGAPGNVRFPVHQVLHPSPASPAANRGWAAQLEKQLAASGIKFHQRSILQPCALPSSISSDSHPRSSRGANARTSKRSHKK